MQRSSTAQPPTVHATHIGAPEQEYGASGRSGGPLRIAIIGIAALLVLVAALLAWYEVGHSERIYKGVSVLGTDLSGMSRDEAAAALTQATSGYPGGSVAIDGAGQTWTFAAADLGVSADVQKTLDTAMSLGRSGNLLDNLGTQLRAFFGGSEALPVLKQDAASLDKIVAQIAAQVDRPAVDSKLEKDASGVVNLTASAEGLAVDKSALRQSLMAATANVPFGNATLTTQAVAPKVTEAELQGAKAQALLLTEQPVVLTAGKQSWTIQPDDLRDFLTLDRAADGKVTAALDNNQLAAFLQPVGQKLLVEPQDATITIGKGTVTLTDDVPGQVLDAPAAIAAIQQAATGADTAGRTVTLPLKQTPAGVHTQDLQALYDKANALVTQGMRLKYADDGYILRGSNVTGFIDVKPGQGGPGR